MRIVFMGTPEFAVPSLNILLENGYDVVGVITATDKIGGRGGKQFLESAVKKFAKEKGLKILQPPKLKDPGFLEELRSLKADLQVVVAFRMLPEVVWNMPTTGTFNLHGSLLPKYRGAAPINWAVINGDHETGVTTFFIKHEIDTGDVLFREKMSIGVDETAGEVHDRMMHLGARLVLKTVQAIESDNYTLKAQDPAIVSKAPKIFHETCEIDFGETTAVVHNFIRGLSPYPGAWTRIKVLETTKRSSGKSDAEDLELKIFRSEKETGGHEFSPGHLLTDGKKSLKFATKDGFLKVLELQLQGRRRMPVSDFLNGHAHLLES
jgi:methionyl-tRNA formyltransferase